MTEQLTLDLGPQFEAPEDAPAIDAPQFEQQIGERPDFLTAFLVIVDYEGNAKATSELEAEFVVARRASLGEMRRACQEVAHEIDVRDIIARVSGLLPPTPPSVAARVATRLQSRAA